MLLYSFGYTVACIFVAPPPPGSPAVSSCIHFLLRSAFSSPSLGTPVHLGTLWFVWLLFQAISTWPPPVSELSPTSGSSRILGLRHHVIRWPPFVVRTCRFIGEAFWPPRSSERAGRTPFAGWAAAKRSCTRTTEIPPVSFSKICKAPFQFRHSCHVGRLRMGAADTCSRKMKNASHVKAVVLIDAEVFGPRKKKKNPIHPFCERLFPQMHRAWKL